MIQWMLAIWSLVPLPFLNPAWTSGSSWFTYIWNFKASVEALLGKFWAWLCWHVKWVQLHGNWNILWHWFPLNEVISKENILYPLNTNNAHSARDVYRGGCSHPQGPWQKEYLLRNSPPGTYFGSSISGATRRDGKVKERENKAPVAEDGESAGETQQDTQSWPEFWKPETSFQVTQSSIKNVPWNFP